MSAADDMETGNGNYFYGAYRVKQTLHTDPAYFDELERRGDSFLDEEAWRRSNTHQDLPDRVLMVQTSNGPFVAIDVPHRLYTVDEARNLANAILSELEIAQREGDGEW